MKVLGTLDTIVVLGWLVLIAGIGMLAGLKANAEKFWANDRKTPTAFLVFTIVATQVGGGTILGVTATSFEKGTGYGIVLLVSAFAGMLAVSFLAPWAKRFGDRVKAFTLPDVFRARYGRSTQVAAGLVVLFGLLVPLMIWKEPVAAVFSAIPRAAWSPTAYGGWTFLVGGVLLGALIPVVSLEMWMRAYAASSEKAARSSFLWSAAAVVPFYALPLLVGVFATKATILPAVERPQALMIDVMLAYLPTGLRGLGVSAMLAVLISTVNTLIIVPGAALYRDVLGWSATSEKKSLLHSRLATLAVGVVGLALSYVLPRIDRLMLIASYTMGVLGPPLVGVVFWKRATSKGALAGIIAGAATILALVHWIPEKAFVPGLLVSVVTLVAVSLLTKHQPGENLSM